MPSSLLDRRLKRKLYIWPRQGMQRLLSTCTGSIADAFMPCACVWLATHPMRETFLQLFRKIGTFRGESAFSTWLHRMTVNVVLMRLRKKTLPAASLEETTEPDEETGGPRKDIGAPDLRLSGAVDRVNLERSIEKLPPGYRTVFVLHDVQGFEHNEIAGIMGCSVGNSKSQLHKARTRLRELLQEDLRDQARSERHAAKTQAGLGD